MTHKLGKSSNPVTHVTLRSRQEVLGSGAGAHIIVARPRCAAVRLVNPKTSARKAAIDPDFARAPRSGLARRRQMNALT